VWISRFSLGLICQVLAAGRDSQAGSIDARTPQPVGLENETHLLKPTPTKGPEPGPISPDPRVFVVDLGPTTPLTTSPNTPIAGDAYRCSRSLFGNPKPGESVMSHLQSIV
jgi:hypothetical protein